MAPQMGVEKEKLFTDSVIQSQSMEQYPIVMHNLGKAFGKMHAVDNVNLTIRKGK